MAREQNAYGGRNAQQRDYVVDRIIRPDGRALLEPRPTSIGFGAIPTADGSALVKIGNTTMLAGIKLEVMRPALQPNEGEIVVTFEAPAICSGSYRERGRQMEEACAIGEQVSNAIQSAGMVDRKELCILAARAAWKVYVDVYCLDLDGSLVDAALLASVAALVHLRLPSIAVDDEGKVLKVGETNDERVGPGGTKADVGKPKAKTVESKRLTLGPIPFSVTCGETQAVGLETAEALKEGRGRSFDRAKTALICAIPATGPVMLGRTGWETRCQGPVTVDMAGEKQSGDAAMAVGGTYASRRAPWVRPVGTPGNRGHIILDPLREEEASLKSVVTVVMDERGRLISVYKPGGISESSDLLLQDCIKAAKLRSGELQRLLHETFRAAEEYVQEDE